MKFFISALIIIAFSMHSTAQTNLLDQMQVDNTMLYSLIEKGNYYFIIREVEGGTANNISNRKPRLYYLNKYDKQNNTLIASVHIAGDTLQNDSTLMPNAIMLNRGSKLYIQYCKCRVTNNVVDTPTYFMKIDTALNVVVPEKYLSGIHNGLLVLGGAAIQDDGRCILGYAHNQGFMTSKYLLLDSMGNELANGNIGVVPTPPNSWPIKLRQITNLPNNKYLVTGNDVSGNGTAQQPFGWTTVDSNMNILDTFLYKKGLMQSNEPFTFTIVKPKMIGLATGSLISGNNIPPINGDSYSSYPMLIKHTAATRYGIDDYISFLPIDNSDSAHGNAFALNSLLYNPYDNSIYYASTTHMAVLGLSCAENSFKSYLEIICIDTSLNLKWRKFFKMGGECSSLASLSLPDGRNGILAIGMNFLSNDALDQWAYYINDQTPSDTPTDITDITLKKEDGFVLYPNPAHNEVHLVSDKELKEALVYDLSGRFILAQRIISGKATLNIDQLSPGIYLIKATDKAGRVYQKKMVKK